MRFKLRNGSIDNRVMGAAVLNDRIGSRNIFAEKNLMIIKSFVRQTFLFFNYLILVYIIYTC